MPYEVRLRPARLRALCNEKEWSIQDFADVIEMGVSTVYRVLRQHAQPGPEFIAGCAVAFGEHALPDLFTFVTSAKRNPRTRSAKRVRSFAPKIGPNLDEDVIA